MPERRSPSPRTGAGSPSRARWDSRATATPPRLMPCSMAPASRSIASPTTIARRPRRCAPPVCRRCSRTGSSMVSEAAPTTAPRTALARGAAIDGFRIGERIHAGGNGYIHAVSAAGAPDPGFPLVMKMPAVGLGEPWIGVVAFEMELMILPVFQGAKGPRFSAAGALHTTPYIVMERTPGEGLAAVCARAPLAADEVVCVGVALADALHSLHVQQVVHHDVKPENVILRADGSAVLLDFGFACHARYPDLLGEQRQFEAGSARYVSPAQLRHPRGEPPPDPLAPGAGFFQA